jgi:hypothetical protein
MRIQKRLLAREGCVSESVRAATHELIWVLSEHEQAAQVA